MQGTTSCNGLYAKVESVEAVDDLTVKMVLVDPNLDWPYMMTLPTASILSEKAVTEDPKKDLELELDRGRLIPMSLETHKTYCIRRQLERCSECEDIYIPLYS